jgi:hypothetical protein
VAASRPRHRGTLTVFECELQRLHLPPLQAPNLRYRAWLKTCRLPANVPANVCQPMSARGNPDCDILFNPDCVVIYCLIPIVILLLLCPPPQNDNDKHVIAGPAARGARGRGSASSQGLGPVAARLALVIAAAGPQAACSKASQESRWQLDMASRFPLVVAEEVRNAEEGGGGRKAASQVGIIS